MQLKEKIDVSFLKSKKQTLFKVVFSVLGFVAVTAVAYLLLYICQLLNLFSALNHIPLSFMAFVYFVIFILNLLSCTMGLSRTLYYAKDNQVLVTYPVNPNILFLSKMLVYYVSEVKKSFQLLIPIFLAYGIISSLNFFFFIYMPIMFVILAAVPVLLGGLLSIPMNYILRFMKRYPIIKTIFVGVVLACFVALVIYLINLIPENINLIKSWTVVSKTIRSFLSGVAKYLYIFYALTLAICGTYENMHSNFFTTYTYAVPLILIAIVALLIVINYVTSRPLYLKMITKQFEFDKNLKLGVRANTQIKSFASACVYETKRNIRNTDIFSTSLATLIIAPIAVLFLNKFYSAINTRLAGQHLTVAFNILIIMLFVLAHNINVSAIYSRDGDALPLLKTRPNKPFEILISRLFYNFAFSVLILVASCSVFFTSSSLGAFDCVLIFFMMLFVTSAYIIWSAEIDFLKPNSNVFKTEGSAGINPNELKATILAFALSAICFGLSYFLLNEGLGGVWLKLCLVSLAFFAIRLYLFFIKSKTLFGEV